MFVRDFLIPKKGNKLSECEDSLSYSEQRMKFAVADGASEGFDSKTWAKLLTKTWVRDKSSSSLEKDYLYNFLHPLSERWKKKWQKDDLPWYVSEKAKQGSYCAFVGLEISLEDDIWKVISLGDCCFFQIDSNNKIVKAIPIEDGDSFNNNPPLLSTNAPHFEEFSKNLIFASGHIDKDRRLLLMSDAISSWFIRTSQYDSFLISDFIARIHSNDKAALIEFVNSQRNDHVLKNDDIAIILIDCQ